MRLVFIIVLISSMHPAESMSCSPIPVVRHKDPVHWNFYTRLPSPISTTGQVVYYEPVHLFLTSCSVYHLVWDVEKASKMRDLRLEDRDLGIRPWLRCLTFRVPEASVVHMLAGNKRGRVARGKHTPVRSV